MVQVYRYSYTSTAAVVVLYCCPVPGIVYTYARVLLYCLQLIAGTYLCVTMSSDRDRVADGKLPRRRSGGGGSKKSSRTSSSSSRTAAGAVDGAGGDRARGGPDREVRKDSRDNGGGGGVARPDYLPPSGAQGKDTRAEAAPSRSRSGAKASRRGSGRGDAGGEGGYQERSERSQHQQKQQLAASRTAGPPAGNVDRAILDK